LKDCFVKDKRGEDPRLRYYVAEETLKSLEAEFPGGDSNSELKALAEERLRPLLEEVRQAEREAEEKRRIEKER